MRKALEERTADTIATTILTAQGRSNAVTFEGLGHLETN